MVWINGAESVIRNIGQNMSTNFRIETPSLVLRPLTLGDTRRVLEMSQEDCARRWLPSQVYPDERHAVTAIEHMIGQFDLEASPTTNAFVFGAEEKLTGRLIEHALAGMGADRVLAFLRILLRLPRVASEILVSRFLGGTMHSCIA